MRSVRRQRREIERRKREEHGTTVVDLEFRRSVTVLCRGIDARQRRARPPGGARVRGERGNEGRGENGGVVRFWRGAVLLSPRTGARWTRRMAAGARLGRLGVSVVSQSCRGCVRRDQLVGGPGELRRTSALSRGRGARVRSEATVASWERRPVVLGRVQGRQREQGRARERRWG